VYFIIIFCFFFVFFGRTHSSYGLAPFYFFLRSLPGLPLPRAEVVAWSIFFSDSTLTRKEGELTSLFPTL